MIYNITHKLKAIDLSVVLSDNSNYAPILLTYLISFVLSETGFKSLVKITRTNLEEKFTRMPIKT